MPQLYVHRPCRTTLPGLFYLFIAGWILAGPWCVPGAAAQSPEPPSEMCGDGTTFTVQLPGTTLGVDDFEGLFTNIGPAAPPADSVTLPNGCRTYAIFVSGYANNRNFTDIPFYKVAEFIAHHNGYVHMAWWNNLLKEYMGGPLHPVNIVVRRLFGLRDDVVIPPGPSSLDLGLESFAPSFVDLPKANPDEDFQFQSDAALVIRAIREHNPNAIIVVAGHSMGGNAVVHLGMNPALRDVTIDLLAPIDPVNNRDKPRGIPGERNFNWTRWRAAHEFRGFKQWDCVRNGLGLCQDFDSRLFHTSYRCYPAGDFLPVRPIFPSRAPIACPAIRPYVDPGVKLGFGPNIRHLYHRWQHEFFWPVDFPANEPFDFPQPSSSSIFGANYQFPVLPSLGILTNDPDRTCEVGIDPRDPSYECDPTDGHGEIIGHRGPKGEQQPGLKMQNWPDSSNPAGRRAALIEMATAPPDWFRRPVNPDLCLVCDDMLAIVQHLLDEQPSSPGVDSTAPVVVASVTPGPNENGWNNEDVVVDLEAHDEQGGSGVSEIDTTLSGAQTGGGAVTGASRQETITAEGETTVSYFARDEAGNAGTPATIDVKIDRTAPSIEANTDIDPNANGWFHTNVLVTFNAADEPGGSGLANSAADVPMSTEGAAQDVVGTAEDHAGNASTAVVTLNIDKTSPTIVLSEPSRSAVYLLGAPVKAAYTCADVLSGAQSCTAPVASGGSIDTSTVGSRTFSVKAVDLAGNLSEIEHSYSVQYRFSGFGDPIAPTPTLNEIKAGRTVPVKYILENASGSPVGDLASFVSLTSSAVACDDSVGGGMVDAADAAGTAGIRFDAESGQYIYNWKTRAAWAGTCRVLQLNLLDGTQRIALFRFR